MNCEKETNKIMKEEIGKKKKETLSYFNLSLVGGYKKYLEVGIHGKP
jgi:hypothetical protein